MYFTLLSPLFLKCFQALKRIAEYAESHKDREWIIGGGWQFGWFENGAPTAKQLDEVVPDRPAVLTCSSFCSFA